MRIMCTDEIRCLEVINICGGERLGFPVELEIDLDCARVLSFTVARGEKCFSFLGDREEYVIPWCKIDCIGEDAILVRLSDAELSGCTRGRNRKKRR